MAIQEVVFHEGFTILVLNDTIVIKHLCTVILYCISNIQNVWFINK